MSEPPSRAPSSVAPDQSDPVPETEASPAMAPREPAGAGGVEPPAVEPSVTRAVETVNGQPPTSAAAEGAEAASGSDGPPDAASPDAAPGRERPSFVFFGIVAACSLIADVASKAWAEVVLTDRFEPITLIEGHLTLTLAYNPGGAWGLLGDASEAVRKPFFLAVSVAAILFIVSLYGRLSPNQHALRWGLPLVLGGALGNLSDRVTRGSVIDFIDYSGEWVRSMNRFVHEYVPSWTVTDHWPTFNIADVAICVGVVLMAVDMFTAKRGPAAAEQTALSPVPGQQVPPVEQPPAASAGLDAGSARAEAAPAPGQSLSSPTDPARGTGTG